MEQPVDDRHDPRLLVVGVDAGATSTRAVLLAADGTVRGRGRAGGANLNSSGVDPSEPLAEAVGAALSDAGAPAGTVGAGVIGMAGAGAAGLAQAEGAAGRAWRRLGLRGRPQVFEDNVVAFAAGSDPREGVLNTGLVLGAGTGAYAAAITGGEVTATCDGYGWLLGDDGSAVWLGRAAARAALRAVDGRGPATTLVERVGAALGVGPPAAGGAAAWAQAVIGVVYAQPPAAIGRLAPAVTAAAASDGDKLAGELLDAAADRLAGTLAVVAGTTPWPVVVLAGALLEPGNPVGARVRERITDRWPATEQRHAGPGEVGAALLALEHATRG